MTTGILVSPPPWCSRFPSIYPFISFKLGFLDGVSRLLQHVQLKLQSVSCTLYSVQLLFYDQQTYL